MNASPPIRKVTLAILLTAGLLSPGSTAGYETDQYTDRLKALADSTEILDRKVNDALQRVAADWRHGTDPKLFATRVYREIGGRHWVDKLERFAVRSPEIARFEQERRSTIYRNLPFWTTPVVHVVGVGKTIKLDDTLVGTDKIGHFLSQGWKYYKRHWRGRPEEDVIRLGVRNESGLFGAASTGVFSNADLVANYEGYLFYRSLFEDDVVAGKPAIIRFDGLAAVVERPFSWRDHVNEYWDEALNPNHYRDLLGKHVARNLSELCSDYARKPSAYVPSINPVLEQRYARIGLRDASAFRLDQICSTDRISSVRSLRGPVQ